MPRPRREQLVLTIRKTHDALSELIGRWTDSLTPELRAELHRIDTPLIETLDAEEGRNGPRVG